MNGSRRLRFIEKAKLQTSLSGGYAMRKMGFMQTTAEIAAHIHAWNSGKLENGQGSTNPNGVLRWFENKSWGGDSPVRLRLCLSRIYFFRLAA
jgi:hypothetical protein